MESKKNCWEYKKCGKEPGGSNVDDLGSCPAAIEEIFDGLNNGKNGGRICWAVVGTFCCGEVQGEFARKLDSCMNCKFFKRVEKEEKRFKLLKDGRAYKPEK